jgi:hypothetical protein
MLQMMRGRIDAEVQAFFDRMARAITSGDTRAIAGQWAVPALVLGDTMAKAVGTIQEVEQFFSGAREQYNQRGITDTRAEIFGLEWVTDRMAIVDVRWPYLDAHGEENGSESSTYVIRRGDDGLIKLQAALFRGAATP